MNPIGVVAMLGRTNLVCCFSIAILLIGIASSPNLVGHPDGRAATSESSPATESSQPEAASDRFVAVEHSVPAIGATFHRAPVATVDDLIEIIESSREQIRPIESVTVERAADRIRESLNEATRVIDRGSEENASGWREYLKVAELEVQLGEAEPDLLVFRQVAERLRRNSEGLELPLFVDLRDSLQRYVEIETLARIEDWEGQYSRLLDQLNEQLVTFSDQKTALSHHNMGRIIGILATAEQAPELVSAFRQYFGQANVQFFVSEDFVSNALRTPFEDVQPVSEMILGTMQRGTARTTGAVQFDFVSDSDQAHIVARLTAQSVANNIGHRRPIKIRSISHSTISAFADIHVDLNSGIQVGDPCVQARTSTQICCIDAPRLIYGIARSQVYAKKGQAECIAARRVEARMAQSFGDRLDDAVENNRSEMQFGIRDVLQRLDARPETTSLHTTDDQLRFSATQANRFQLGPNDVAQFDTAELDFGVAIHQSAINNLFESILAGKTLDRDRLLELLEAFSPDVQEQVTSEIGDDEWSIRFPSTRPVMFEAKEGGIRVTITGTRFTQGSRPAISDPMQIIVDYRIQKDEQGNVSLVREGELTAQYLGSGTSSTRHTAMRSFARSKFSLLFPESFEFESVTLPEQFQSDESIRLHQLQALQGWIQLGWARN